MRRSIFYLLLIILRINNAWRSEVAVIMGGKSEAGTEHFEVEVYTERSDSCAKDLHGLQAEEVFDYIGASTNAAGLYLDNLGLFVCGGMNLGVPDAECYYYYFRSMPGLFRWSKFDYEKETDIFQNHGILDTAMEAWDFNTGELGFYQVGGRYNVAQDPSMLSTYKYKDGDTVINQEPNNEMPYPRAGHCFVRVKTSSDGRYQYLAIGGETSPENTAQINYYYCNDEDCTNWNWEVSIVPELDQITGHSCAVFEESDEEGEVKEVVLIAGGKDDYSMKTFVLSSFCDSISHKCNWTAKDATNLPQPLSHGRLVTLDGVPYIFGGNNGTFATDTVYKFISGNWIEMSRMLLARQNHLVLAVPEDWLCYGTFTTTAASTSISDSTSTASITTMSTSTDASTTFPNFTSMSTSSGELSKCVL